MDPDEATEIGGGQRPTRRGAGTGHCWRAMARRRPRGLGTIRRGGQRGRYGRATIAFIWSRSTGTGMAGSRPTRRYPKGSMRSKRRRATAPSTRSLSVTPALATRSISTSSRRLDRGQDRRRGMARDQQFAGALYPPSGPAPTAGAEKEHEFRRDPQARGAGQFQGRSLQALCRLDRRLPAAGGGPYPVLVLSGEQGTPKSEANPNFAGVPT